MISVVVPAHNRRETLGDTLDSLLAQTYERWRAIVVDDGSRDGTAELAEEHAARDDRIAVHHQPHGGVSSARNAGIALARTPWLFFLDADDWIVPTAFERLMGAVEADPDVDAVYGGYIRIDAAGRELDRQLPEREEDLFPLFARTCAIAVHTCVVRTEVVRRAGGFDASLTTCEDWDLWQRIARAGARFGAIPDYIARYRVRVGSASARARRMLEDGLVVIDRGHGEDPRVPAPPVPRAPLSRAARDVARTYYACYTAGLEIAAGNDARPLIELLGDGISGDVDPGGVASTLFHAIPVGRATAAVEWSSFPPEVDRQAGLFVDALGERIGDHWLAHGARGELERLVLSTIRDERPLRAGRWYLMELDLEGPPPADLELDPVVERLLCSVRLGDERIADVEVPVVDGWVPARVLADAIVAGHAWEILRAFFERHVYPGRTLEAEDEILDPAELHDRVGWTVFLQELWGEVGWGSDEFYDGARPTHAEAAAPPTRASERVEVELAAPLPSLELPDRDHVSVAVHVAGVPLTVVEAEAPGGVLPAAELRRRLLLQTGFELCRAVMREAIVLTPADAGGPLRERLARARARAGAIVPDGVVCVGRGAGPDGSSASRWLALPAATAQRRLALARTDGEVVTGSEADGMLRLLSAPVSLTPSAARSRLSDDALLRSIEFERIFGARPDPWHYSTAYEQDKYQQTLALLPRRAECALELGCAEGVFTELLAPRVGTLTAADISLVAIGRASRRCTAHRNVVFAQMDVVDGPLDGPYDLIVCSEMLYYAGGPEQLDRAVRRLVAALTPGGHLVTAHAHVLADDPAAPGFDWDVPFGAVTIEHALLATGGLALQRELRTSAYRVQRYVRRASTRRRRRLLPVRRGHAEASAMAPEHRQRFHPEGGQPRREAPPESPAPRNRLPILMYHRVAPDGVEASRRWRLHPDDFKAQLRHLRDAGYRSITFEQWRAAADRRIRIPARSIMLTFDDGYADFTDYAWPLLLEYGFRATMFVVTDLVGASNAWDEKLGETLPLMDWPTLVNLRRQGLELGSHSALHRPLVTLSAAALADDLCRSRASFHEHLGEAVRSIGYPYGLHDTRVRAIAGACGFRYGVTTSESLTEWGEDLLCLPRLEVRGTTALSELLAHLDA
jgi:peptidoglycan/xylan/chitin deacetylase (PgdA/CDA1 family)/2-polyprenyl-3-methyl-5-hydroxy-6-metoxy-1,4-benzoquinol methylase